MPDTIHRILFLSLFLFFDHCNSSSEFSKTATSFGMEETIVYGSSYAIRSFFISKEELPNLRKRLYNSLVMDNPTNRLEEWKKIQNLPNEDCIGFYLFPETLIIPEYIAFQFEWNKTRITPNYISYATTISGKVNQEPGFIWGGTPFTFYPPDTRVYSIQSMQRYSSSVDIKWQHSYLFLFLIQNSILKNTPNTLRVVSPLGGIADFSYNINDK